MRTVGGNTLNYLNSRQGVVTRVFVYIIAKNRTTGAVEEIGFSNLPYNVTVTVISGQTGLPVDREYVGAGPILDVGDVNLVSDLTIQTLRVKLTQTDAAVNNAIRGYDARNAKMELHYGLFDLSSRKMVDPAYPHFVGIINKAPITRAKVGSSGGVSVEAVSRTRELTISNPAVKSDEFQKSRFPGDDFRKHSNVAHLWAITWGEAKAVTMNSIAAAQQPVKYLNGKG